MPADSGRVQIEVPRDRDATFEPVIVKKRQRRLNGIDEIVLSLTARGLTTGEVAAHFDEVYGAKVSKDTISRITDKVLEEMTEWQNRPLDSVYPVLFVDAIHLKVRDGQVSNRPFYVVIGVTVDGHRDVLGIWAGDGGEGAKYWLQVLTEIKNRGVADVCIAVCDGLKGLPESITTVWAPTLVQTCVLHLIRNTFRYASRRYWEQMAKDLRPVYTAPTEAAASARFDEFTEQWGALYPAIITLWRSAWSEFVPFLDYDVEIRKVICSTNAIESINARYRRAVKARGHFPTEQAALKCLYLVTRSLDPTGKWSGALGDALEARAERLRDRLPRTYRPVNHQLTHQRQLHPSSDSPVRAVHDVCEPPGRRGGARPNLSVVDVRDVAGKRGAGCWRASPSWASCGFSESSGRQVGSPTRSCSRTVKFIR